MPFVPTNPVIAAAPAVTGLRLAGKVSQKQPDAARPETHGAPMRSGNGQVVVIEGQWND